MKDIRSCSAPMVRAILSGQKTQTRRPVTAQTAIVSGSARVRPEVFARYPLDKDVGGPRTRHQRATAVRTSRVDSTHPDDDGAMVRLYSPWCAGDHLWVRETWAELLAVSPSTGEPLPITDGERLIEPPRPTSMRVETRDGTTTEPSSRIGRIAISSSATATDFEESKRTTRICRAGGPRSTCRDGPAVWSWWSPTCAPAAPPDHRGGRAGRRGRAILRPVRRCAAQGTRCRCLARLAMPSLTCGPTPMAGRRGTRTPGCGRCRSVASSDPLRDQAQSRSRNARPAR